MRLSICALALLCACSTNEKTEIYSGYYPIFDDVESLQGKPILFQQLSGYAYLDSFIVAGYLFDIAQIAEAHLNNSGYPIQREQSFFSFLAHSDGGIEVRIFSREAREDKVLPEEYVGYDQDYLEDLPSRRYWAGLYTLKFTKENKILECRGNFDGMVESCL